MAKIEKLILSLLIALSVTITSIQITYFRLSEVGLGCGGNPSSPCFTEVLHGGIPFAFLIDSYKVAGIGKLDLMQDTFVAWAFIVNLLIYMALIYPVVSLLIKKLSWPRVRNRHS